MMEKCFEVKFYYCKHCGKIIALVKDSGTPTICCGQEMEEMKPGTEDTLQEKHVPVVVKEECKVVVKVGSVPHPMTADHFIEWVLLQTDKGIYSKCLKPGEDPRVEFRISQGEKIKGAYEFCNIHKLWKCKNEKQA